MTPLWKWLMANLPSNILPVLSSCCREWGGEQSRTGLVEHHLKWLATPQKVRLFGMMPQAFISFCSSSWVVGFFCLVIFPLPISAFCLGFHLLNSPCSTETQLLSFCQSFGAGRSIWVLCFFCFLFGLVCLDFYWEGVIYVFYLLEGGITWGGFCSGNVFFF